MHTDQTIEQSESVKRLLQFKSWVLGFNMYNHEEAIPSYTCTGGSIFFDRIREKGITSLSHFLKNKGTKLVHQNVMLVVFPNPNGKRLGMYG